MRISSKKNRKQKKLPELRIARAILIVLGAMTMLSYFYGCRATEKIITRTEYVDKVKIDTVSNAHYDSIYIRERGDTVYVSKYKYIDRYRVKIERDTVLKTDTINYITPPIETKVPVEVHVYGLFWWIGLLFCITLAGYIVFKLVTKTPFISVIKKFLNIN